MQPGRQWKERIDIWIQAIKEQIYRPIGETTVSGFYTFEQLTKEQALEQEFVPVEKEPYGEKNGSTDGFVL